ncbi:MAG: enolase C-terminal domain-like protein [Candidatus Nanoarchaeia archaeon]
MKIKEIKAKKISNSRNQDTIQIFIKTDMGKAEASAPSGASKSKKEVMDFPTSGVNTSVEFVNNVLNQELKDFEINEFNDFEKIENILKKYDDTERWEIIGGNTVIALEFALLKMLSKGQIWSYLNPGTEKLPRPLGNIIGGGAHVKKTNAPEIQEFLLLSLNCKSFTKAAYANYKIHKLVKKQIKKYLSRPKMTDEGAWSPELTIEQILDILTKVVSDYNKTIDFEIRIGLDVAAGSFYDGKEYVYRNKKLTRKEQIKYMIDLIEKYNLCYVEDPLEENDFKGFAEITKKVRKTCLICGDDLIATRIELLKKAIKENAITSLIVKPNQIGSIVKTREIIKFAKENKIYPVISHRSGETMDSTIADLSIAFNVPIIKCGIYGKEREVKINRIINIEEEIKRIKKK